MGQHSTMRHLSRHSTILLIGLAAGVLMTPALVRPAAAQAVMGPDMRQNGLMETSPSSGTVRTYSNGARVPVPQNPPTEAERMDGDTTGSVTTRRVPNPHTTRNSLGCPEIDPLCQGR
ncbi:hypothetical protein GCM10007301_46680 [Azorhizobium oxalatiphilum]|uniref:Uncharacterized protein n=1 Tax=Azorhizobium oxalatiphilum TaxID=980631 RepID=A0A917CCV9_9HYPH|nr:hypothetical protein [Azorhizobium oxalatiphilum]GGF81216.1 hypothetical protein GCM10007301_46680 [Azorhizobium oxalatiphilum]